MFKHFFISHNILCVAVQPKVSNSSHIHEKPSLSSTTLALLSSLLSDRLPSPITHWVQSSAKKTLNFIAPHFFSVIFVDAFLILICYARFARLLWMRKAHKQTSNVRRAERAALKVVCLSYSLSLSLLLSTWVWFVFV